MTKINEMINLVISQKVISESHCIAPISLPTFLLIAHAKLLIKNYTNVYEYMKNIQQKYYNLVYDSLYLRHNQVISK